MIDFTEDELLLIQNLVEDDKVQNIDWKGNAWNDDELVTQLSILDKIDQFFRP